MVQVIKLIMKKIDANILLKFNGNKFITELYRDILGRNPDSSGFSHFKKLLDEGASKEYILHTIATSEEAIKKNLKIVGLEKIKQNDLKLNKKKESWISNFIKLPTKILEIFEEIEKQKVSIEEISNKIQKNILIPAADNTILANIQGFIMGLPAEDLSVLAQLVYYGNLEQGLETAFKKYVKTGMTVIDIGAHIGLYTLLAARNVGDKGKVYSFEPTPRTFNLLRQNININFFVRSNKIIHEQLAITNKKGQVKFFIFKEKTGHNSLHFSGKKNNSILVKTTSLDAYLKVNEKVDVVKIDAEGSEPQIIKGMKNIIKNNPKIIIFMEFCPLNLKRAKISPINFLYELKKLNFEIRLVDDFSGELLPIDEKKLINCFSENLMLTKANFYQ